MKKEKKEKKAKKGEESNAGVAELSAKMDQMIGGLNTVGSALAKLVEIQSAKPESSSVVASPEVKKERSFNPKLDDETYPNKYIPPKYRQLVNEILSPDFGIDITDFDDRTDFQIHIIVPDEYSSITQEDRDKGVKDIRSRMIPRALGENGVREWCTLIRQNLNKYYSREGKASPFHN